MLTLYPHQKEALQQTQDKNCVAYYHDMGLGKTFTGGEKMMWLGAKVNLVICQKSKIDDWIQHFKTHYNNDYHVYDLTNKLQFDAFIYGKDSYKHIGVINYDLVWRRPELKRLHDFTLLLDESSLIQNETAKRSKFIMKLDYANLILLSGTPTGGKYEKLYSQLNMLGYNMTKKSFYNMYVNFHYDKRQGFPLMIIDGYKNVERLKRKMREYGCNFLKTEEVLNLPDQNFITVKVKKNSLYGEFMKNRIVRVPKKLECTAYNESVNTCEFTDYTELVGDTTLTKLLYARQLCGAYSDEKLKAFTDLVESTNDRLIVFYNFNNELEQLINICDDLERPHSIVNGSVKDLTAYENITDSITLIQYQAGAMGLNLQRANKIIYYTPPLSSELYEQSKKRIHRIGQQSSCFYYNLICTGSVEEKIYKTLEMRKDYTEALFERGD